MNELLKLTYEELSRNPEFWAIVTDTNSKFSKVVFCFENGVISKIETQENENKAADRN
jgi:hypothetical protein